MNYYGYDFIRESDLTHHGILGQKWGVRRFQNKDGTRTAAGKSRYKRGKEYSEERSRISMAESKRLKQANAKKIKSMQDEAFAIAEKYGLDMDDGGGGNYAKYSEKQLRDAGQKYLQLWNDIDALTDQAEQQGFDYANKELIRKYGDQAISDINYYAKTNSTIAIASIGSIWALSMYALMKS